jgi:hypothetical protein
MLKKKITAFAAAMSLPLSALAGNFRTPIVMDGTTQTADTAELRFDPTPSNTGVLIVLGDHSGTARRTYQFVYDVPEKQPDPTARRVNITFADKTTLSISCDPLSDNCRSLDYVVKGANTFSLMWKIEHK